MIIDFEDDLKFIERQPVMVGIDKRIKALTKKREDVMSKYQKYQNEKLIDVMNGIDEDIQFFKNILGFWALNYKWMEDLKKIMEANANNFNRLAALAQQVEDLRMILDDEMETHNYMYQYLGDKGHDSMNKLRDKAREYYTKLKAKYDEQN